MQRLRAFVPLLVLAALGVALLASGALERLHPAQLLADPNRLHAVLGGHAVLAPVLYVLLMAVVAATGMPGALLLVMASGILFGPLAGTVLSTLGLTAGSCVLFLASRRAFEAGAGQAPALVERLRTGFHAYPLSYTLFLRLIPLFPFGAVTVALAWLRCRPWLFVLTTLIGGSVTVAFECSLGAGLADGLAREGRVGVGILAHRDVLLPLLGLAVLALVPALVGRWRRRPRGGDEAA